MSPCQGTVLVWDKTDPSNPNINYPLKYHLLASLLPYKIPVGHYRDGKVTHLTIHSMKCLGVVINGSTCNNCSGLENDVEALRVRSRQSVGRTKFSNYSPEQALQALKGKTQDARELRLMVSFIRLIGEES